MKTSDEVHWSAQGAAEAAHALYHLADRLDALARERALLAQGLLDPWQGAHRIAFDDRLDLLLRRTLHLAARFREQAHRVVAADAQCRAEVEQRARWRRGG